MFSRHPFPCLILITSFVLAPAFGQRLDALITAPGVPQVPLWLNDGTGMFTESEEDPIFNTGDARSIALGDLDNDGDLDAFVGFREANRVILNDGSANFTSTEQELGEHNSVAVALGDLDGDGDLDVFVANWGGPNKVWLNDGSAGFSDSGQAFGSEEHSRCVELGDVDGDGDLDALVVDVNDVPGPRILLNDGQAVFTDMEQNFGISALNCFWGALGDLDGDGDLDLFFARADFDANVVFLNDGTGEFEDTNQALGSQNSTHVALGDLDNDGDLDAYVTNSEEDCDGANRVYLNDGAGVFEATNQYMGSDPSMWVALGDVDEDGDLDAFVANRGSSGALDRLWLNDGTGRFVDSGQRLDGARSSCVVLGVLRSSEEFTAKRLITHVTPAGGRFSSEILLQNPTSMYQSYKFSPVAPDGTSLAPVTGTVPPHQHVSMDAGALFHQDPVAYFEISQQTGVEVSVAYRTPEGMRGVVQESGRLSRRWQWLAGNAELVFDGIAVVNPGNLPANLVLKQVHGDGQEVERIEIPAAVLPRTKELFVLDHWMDPVPGAVIQLIADQGVSVIAVQGNLGQPSMIWNNPVKPLD